MDFLPQDLIGDLLNLGNIFFATILGGIVGLEREKHQKPAGFRTHMIISGACCALVILGRLIIEDYAAIHPVENAVYGADPIRVLQAIIVGVSFIGAGTILKQTGSNQILYLTTAATILLSSSIGIAVALQQYVLAIGIVLLVLFINYVIRRIDQKLRRHSGDQDQKP